METNDDWDWPTSQSLPFPSKSENNEDRQATEKTTTGSWSSELPQQTPLKYRSKPRVNRISLEKTVYPMILGIALLLVIAVVLTATRVGSGPELALSFYVAVPAGETPRLGFEAAAQHETEIAISWLEDETGQTFRRGGAGYQLVEIPGLESVPPQQTTQVILETILQNTDGTVYPVVLTPHRTEARRWGSLTCGQGSPAGLVVYPDNCNGSPSASSMFGSSVSVTIAHELIHGLGAVTSCARHYSGDGHVTDDVNDIVYVRTYERQVGVPYTLDADHDDYFNHNIDGCPDILDSPLWDN